MKRIITLVVAITMAVGLLATGAVAGGHEWHEVPHAHVMLLGVDDVQMTAEGVSFTFHKCVEMTSKAKHSRNRALPTPAHHHSIHTGNAGGSPLLPEPGALFTAGHWVIPLAPYGPPFLTGCDSFNPDGTFIPFPPEE